ncbi:MAG: carboxymuconolactone decarboxylase family protein [Pseudomonadota bacterium]
MTDFKLYSDMDAPAASKALLEKSRAGFGRIPNLHAVMAEAPGLLEAYQKTHQLFMQSSFDKDEQTVVWQTINIEHDCRYCVPAHTAVAEGMGVSAALSDALRESAPLPTPRLEALRSFTLKLVRARGKLGDRDVAAFLEAGFTRRQILEVILCLSQKVMSNYTNHIADTPLDAPFQKFFWK